MRKNQQKQVQQVNSVFYKMANELFREKGKVASLKFCDEMVDDFESELSKTNNCYEEEKFISLENKIKNWKVIRSEVQSMR